MSKKLDKGTDSECFIYLHPEESKSETNNRVGARGWLGQGMGFLFNEDKVIVQEKAKVLKLDSGDGCTMVNAVNTHEIVYLKKIKTVNFVMCVFCHYKK